MRRFLSKKLANIAARVGGPQSVEELIPEATDWQRAMLDDVRRYTMTSLPALWATAQAVEHVVERGIEGDFVECGVWRGGNIIMAGLMRKRLGADFAIRAYDTFAGMTPPTEYDAKPLSELDVKAKFDRLANGDHNDWCYASLDDVQNNYARLVGDDALVTIKGSVLDTLRDPANIPERISVLRLDTDFYDSTLIELETLWPRLAVGGVLMIDDFGEWAGARKATEEYFAGRKLWMHRVDRAVRLIIKQD